MEIKPCPFCGEKPILNGEEKTWWLECESCCFETSFFESEDEAFEFWNTRKEDE